MNLRDYIDAMSAEGKKAFAARADTTVDYLWQLKGGHSRPSPEMCKRLVQASDGILELSELRSDIWGKQSA